MELPYEPHAPSTRSVDGNGLSPSRHSFLTFKLTFEAVPGDRGSVPQQVPLCGASVPDPAITPRGMAIIMDCERESDRDLDRVTSNMQRTISSRGPVSEMHADCHAPVLSAPC